MFIYILLLGFTFFLYYLFGINGLAIIMLLLAAVLTAVYLFQNKLLYMPGMININYRFQNMHSYTRYAIVSPK